MSSRLLQCSLAGLSVALALAVLPLVQAQPEQSPGRIVQIRPDDESVTVPPIPAPNRGTIQGELSTPAAPQFWLGIVGGPLTPELRAHVDIPEGQGLLVREVVPGSPAATAGLKLFDILLRAGDTQLREMEQLVDLVRAAGEQRGELTLEVLRKGQRQSLTVKPEVRPADFAAQRGGEGAGQGIGRQAPFLNELPEFGRFFEQFGAEGAPFELRQFGPGVIVGGRGIGVANLPNGVSISVEKQDDQPARITVQRGGEKWEVIGDDPESLKQLPDDLRPFVSKMLQDGAAGTFQFRGGEGLPEIGVPNFDDRPLLRRLENLERQMQELLQRRSGASSAGGGSAEHK